MLPDNQLQEKVIQNESVIDEKDTQRGGRKCLIGGAVAVGLLVVMAITVWGVNTQKLNTESKAASSTGVTVITPTPTIPYISTSIPLTSPGPLYGLTVDGVVSLQSDDAFARLVLVDSNNNEYLIYETYPSVADRVNFTVSQVCEETCALKGITPTAIKVVVKNAIINIVKTNLSLTIPAPVIKAALVSRRTTKDELVSYVDQMTASNILATNNLNVAKINAFNTKNKKGWTAKVTPFSKKTYAAKLKTFYSKDGKTLDVLPNLQGFEYYADGIFSFP